MLVVQAGTAAMVIMFKLSAIDYRIPCKPTNFNELYSPPSRMDGAHPRLMLTF